VSWGQRETQTHSKSYHHTTGRVQGVLCEVKKAVRQFAFLVCFVFPNQPSFLRSYWVPSLLFLAFRCCILLASLTCVSYPEFLVIVVLMLWYLVPGIIHHDQGRSPRSADAVFFNNSVPYLHICMSFVVRSVPPCHVVLFQIPGSMRAKSRAVTSKVSFGHDP